MSCFDCTNCLKGAPKIPECADNSIYLGVVTDTERKIVRVTNVASGAVTEAVIDPDGSGNIIFTLADFDVDIDFWQSSGGWYAFEIVEYTGGNGVQFTEYMSTTTTFCVLLRFTPIDNVAGNILVTF